jgi:hypothetical protein
MTVTGRREDVVSFDSVAEHFLPFYRRKGAIKHGMIDVLRAVDRRVHCYGDSHTRIFFRGVMLKEKEPVVIDLILSSYSHERSGPVRPLHAARV